MDTEKLVRDKIPDIIRASGETPIVRIASPEEMKSLLCATILEESVELNESGDIIEIVDILEAIEALIKLSNVDNRTIQTLKIKKRDERGGFEKGYVLQME